MLRRLATRRSPRFRSESALPSTVVGFDQNLNSPLDRIKWLNESVLSRYALPIVMAGRDLVAVAQTGF